MLPTIFGNITIKTGTGPQGGPVPVFPQPQFNRQTEAAFGPFPVRAPYRDQAAEPESPYSGSAVSLSPVRTVSGTVRPPVPNTSPATGLSHARRQTPPHPAARHLFVVAGANGRRNHSTVRRLAKACVNVNSSTYSSSSPNPIPRAIDVTLTCGNSRNRFIR